MTGKPRIALTMRVVEASGYVEPRDALAWDWALFLEAKGAIPLYVPNRLADPAAYLEALEPDLLILTGGDDPGTYPERDATETLLLERALEKNLPLLGVCRGIQLINAHFGGGLCKVTGHVAKPHGILVAGAPADCYSAEVEVNSYHNSGIAPEGVGAGLIPFARDAEGHVEGVLHPEKPLAAIMWHPERAAAPEGDWTFITRLINEGVFWT